MKYKLLIGIGIISVILTGCNTVKPTETNLAPEVIHEPVKAELASKPEPVSDPDPVPQEVQVGTAATPDTDENKPQETKLPEKLVIDGWEIGVPFSKIVDKLPKEAEVDHYNSFPKYTFTTANLVLTFSITGYLVEILFKEPGKGLNVKLNVGDDEQQVTKVLGEPRARMSTGEHFNNYYRFDFYDLDIYTKEDKIRAIKMTLTEPRIGEDTEMIAQYFAKYMAEKNRTFQQQEEEQELKNSTSTKSNEDNVVTAKYATREELIALWDDFSKRFYRLLEILNVESDSQNEMLEALFSDININQIQIDLEKASSHWSDKDILLGQEVNYLVVNTLDLYVWKLFHNNAEDEQARVTSAKEAVDAMMRAAGAVQEILRIIKSNKPLI